MRRALKKHLRLREEERNLAVTLGAHHFHVITYKGGAHRWDLGKTSLAHIKTVLVPRRKRGSGHEVGVAHDTQAFQAGAFLDGGRCGGTRLVPWYSGTVDF